MSNLSYERNLTCFAYMLPVRLMPFLHFVINRASSSSPEFECVTRSLTSLANIRVCTTIIYYKVRQGGITKYDSYFITKCDQRYYKVRQVLLQSATGITKCDVITKCDGTEYEELGFS